MGLYRIRSWRISATRTWDPWRDMEELREAIAQIAAQAERSDVVTEEGSFAPQVDLYDAGMVLVVRVDLPGMKRGDLTVAVEGGALKIEGHRTTKESREEVSVRCERPAGRFVRTLPLPSSVAARATRATLDEGVLEVVLPKGDERAAEGVRVHVEVAGPQDD